MNFFRKDLFVIIFQVLFPPVLSCFEVGGIKKPAPFQGIKPFRLNCITGVVINRIVERKMDRYFCQYKPFKRIFQAQAYLILLLKAPDKCWYCICNFSKYRLKIPLIEYREYSTESTFTGKPPVIAYHQSNGR